MIRAIIQYESEPDRRALRSSTSTSSPRRSSAGVPARQGVRLAVRRADRTGTTPSSSGTTWTSFKAAASSEEFAAAGKDAMAMGIPFTVHFADDRVTEPTHPTPARPGRARLRDDRLREGAAARDDHAQPPGRPERLRLPDAARDRARLRGRVLGRRDPRRRRHRHRPRVLRRRRPPLLGRGPARQLAGVLEVVRRVQGHARPAARDRQADDRAHQRDRRRRRQRAADGVRPLRDGRRRVHPARRARARLRPGRRRDAVAPADGRRPPRARDHPPLRRDPGARRPRSGGSSTAPSRRPSSTRPSTSGSRSSLRKLPQTTRYAKQQLNVWRDLAWHQTVGHARDWLAMSMLGERGAGRRARVPRPRQEGVAMADEVLTSRDGAVLTITLNRPDVYNAFNRALHDGARRRRSSEAADPEIRAVVLTGAGRGFCAGPGSAEFQEVAGRRSRRARADLPPEHPRDPRAREARDRGGQRRRSRAPGSRSPARATSASRSATRRFVPGLHRDRPRPRRGRHVVHPPPARLRARVRVDGLEPAPRRGRGARLGPRLRGGRGRRASTRGSPSSRGVVRGAADARGRR